MFRIIFLFAFVFLSPSVFCQSEESIYQSLVWSDEFDGSGAIDESKWFHQTILPNGVSWFNGELQHYTDRTENSYLENGNLHIKAINEIFTDQGQTKQYTSARLNSKFAFTYGRVEVRAKLPSGAGTWPAIWMLGKNIIETGGYWTDEFGEVIWPACGEIDIMEHWGVNPNYVSAAIHTPSSFGNTENVGGLVLSDVFNTYRVYEMEWSPENIKFYVDGSLYYTYEPDVQDSDTWPFDSDQYLLLNVAINPDITPAFTSSEMVIDYVRVYQEGPPPHEFNPLTQVFSNGVLLSWDVPEGAVGCEVRGGPLGGNDGTSATIVNSLPDNIFVNESALSNGGEFQWRVRCATGVNPVSGITDYSEYETFSFPPSIGSREAPLEYTKYGLTTW